MKQLFILSFFLSVETLASVVSFSIVNTGSLNTKEFLIYEGGSIIKKFTAVQSAVLVKHADDYFLFDTGLGVNIDQQFNEDMPWWGKSIFKYHKSKPVKIQIESSGIEIKSIYLSHLHWDHASGLNDFPNASYYVPKDELAGIVDKNNPPNPAAYLKSQFNLNDSNWKPFDFSKDEFMGFELSYDIFGDKSAVIVPLPGHSAGSVGLILSTSKKKYFFVGDLVWSAKALENISSKFFVASAIVDKNRDQIRETMKKVNDVIKKNPDLIIVPAHDGEVQEKIGYFPHWTNL